MDTIRLILENNPGLINIIVTGVILPVAILLLTNRHSRKIKEIEKSLDLRFNAQEDIRNQEKKVYASLSKILFDVQQLHVSLSGTCIDTNCLKDALNKFDVSISKYHEEISNNLLYLSSNAINIIYKFYNQISNLKIELKELNESKNFDMAHVAVYYSSKNLANTVIEMQENFVSERKDLKLQFNKDRQEMMRYCCGTEPPSELKERYEVLKMKVIEKEI